ncbi:FAD-dependent oxidoreductase [Thiotrichales bacterium 19S3-7]|nr:FAD-dependent oxidoreductase [Thiotrichales bacterium 19S3-7]MCF6800649.1 FAD-dependent oxidoreductase [Thiotrichales bacterium 19S3-11]
MSMLEFNRVAVIGCGLMGRVLTLALLKEYPNISINLYDNHTKDGKKSCGYQAAGMLAPMAELMSCHEGIYDYGKNSFELWDQLLNGVIADKRSKILQKKATLILAAQEDKQELERIRSLIHFRMDSLNTCDVNMGQYYGLVSELAIDIADLNTANFYKNCLYFEDEAVINVPLFYQSTMAYFTCHNQIQWFENKTINLDHFACDEVDYDYIFDCRGLGAKCDLQGLFAIRGEAIVIYQPHININQVIRLLHPRYSLYLIPRGNGIYYVGATSIYAEDTSAISIESMMELLSMLYVIDARFSEARIIKTISHCRPSSENDLPIIQDNDSIIRINGLSRHGYLFAPKVAFDVIRLIQGKRQAYVNANTV